MCLKIKQNTQLKTAQNDIECYKTVIYICGRLYSFWHGFCYAQEDKFPTQEKYIESRFDEFCRDDVYNGFHSFQNMASAERDLEITSNTFDSCFVYMRCVIPAGAKYYEGSNADYCSNSLVVTGWRTKSMDQWADYPPCLHPAFGDKSLAEWVRKKMEKVMRVETPKEGEPHVS